MAKIYEENKILLCDICKERPFKETIQISRGVWRGVCIECKPKGEVKND
jgi:hypothetical protein